MNGYVPVGGPGPASLPGVRPIILSTGQNNQAHSHNGGPDNQFIAFRRGEVPFTWWNKYAVNQNQMNLRQRHAMLFQNSHRRYALRYLKGYGMAFRAGRQIFAQEA